MSNIRLMTLDDIDAVNAIETTAHIVPWTRGVLQDCIKVGYDCWVLETNNIIVGYTIFSFGPDECHLLNLCIAKDYQRQGYGSQLLRHVMSKAQQQGAKKLLLEVRRSNLAAIQLYQQFGFNQAGIRKNYYSAPQGREDAIMYDFLL